MKRSTYLQPAEPEIIPAHRGLFNYSGFGMGDLHLTPTDKRWMSSSDAAELCKKLSIKMTQVDSGDPFRSRRLLVRGWKGPESPPEWWDKYNR